LKHKVTAIIAALLLTLGTGIILSGPAQAAPPRRHFQTIVISGTGLNGSKITTTISYVDGVVRCVRVYEKTTTDLWFHTIADTCPPKTLRVPPRH